MKINLSPMELARDFLVLATAAGILYGIALKTGWIIGRSEAQELAQQSVQEEAIDRKLADLKFQKEMTSSSMQLLAAKPDLNEYDKLVLQGYVDDLARINAHIAKLEESP